MFYLIQIFKNIIRKIWLFKKVSRDSLFPLISTDFPIIINDTFYIKTKQLKYNQNLNNK